MRLEAQPFHTKQIPMQFELSKAFLEEITKAIATERNGHIRQQISDLHPADIAEILENLSLTEAHHVYRLLESESGADVLAELDEDKREKLLSSLTSREIAEEVIEKMDSDDAADVLSELPAVKQAEVMSLLNDEEQAELKDLLAYHENSAGGLMCKELIRVQLNWTVATCIREMRRQSKQVDQVYTIYVVNEANELQGRLSLKKLLFASSGTRTLVQDLYEEKVRYAHVDQSSEEVANMFEKYDLVVLPVVDGSMQLLGRITIDDVVDVIKEEADKDYQMASGISEKVESSDTVWVLSRARLPWLLIGMIGGMLGAKVIAGYEAELIEQATLAFFIPLIMAMGGNVGVQSSAIVVQGLANNSIGFDSLWRRLLKELLVSLLNGSILVGLIFGFISLFFDADYALGFTVSTSLMIIIIFAAVFGTFIPLALHRYKIDPALATGPFITTLNDVLSLAVYFIIGSLVFGMG